MITYAEREIFSPRAIEALQYARALVSSVSSHLDREGREVRCHELACAVASQLSRAEHPVWVLDGHLWSIEHTWLQLLEPPGKVLLDVYAPGRLPPVQLLHNHQAVSRGYAACSTSPARSDIRWEVVESLTLEMSSARWGVAS